MGLLEDKARFQSSRSSESTPSWTPAPQKVREFVPTGNVGSPLASRGPGAKKAGLKPSDIVLITGPPPTARRSDRRREAEGVRVRSDAFPQIGPNPNVLGGRLGVSSGVV